MKPIVKIGKIGLDIFNLEELHRIIDQAIIEGQKKTILNINARLVELSHTSDQWLIEYVNNSDHVFCDGAGIQLAAKLTRQVVPQKITYNIWLWQLATFCAANNFSLFLLGGSQDVLSKAIKNLQKANPLLRISGRHGYFDKKLGGSENASIISFVNNYNPNILLVCFGMPLQEAWLKENSSSINSNIFLTGGGALDYISGKVKTTPKIFGKLYLEWLYRLCQDPRRLWKRYLIGNVVFLKILAKDLFKSSVRQ